MVPSLLFLKPLLFTTNSQQIHETAHSFALNTNAPLPFCNRVGNRPGVTLSEISTVKNFFGEIPFRWFVESTDLQTIEHLQHAGFHFKITFPAMSLDLTLLEPITYSAIEVKKVISPAQLEEWLMLVVHTYGTQHQEFSNFIHFLKKMCPEETLHFYTAYYEGIPAAASMSIQHENISALHYVATLPEYRKKGLGYAVTHAALSEAKKRGATQAVLFTSQMGKSLYERIGFKEYALYNVYGL